MEPIGGIEAPYDSCYGVKGVGMEEGAQPVTGSSFTALLELPPTQAMELLHNVGGGASGADSPGNVLNRHRISHQSVYKHTLNCSPVFPSDAALIERAAKYSVFTNGGAALPGGGKDSPEWSSPPSNLSVKVKIEPADSNSNPNSSQQGHEKTAKRKERQKKGKGSSKKCKPEDEEYLPYVHVRARRGQATDSHSLAERARRAKINARMKMLQELVPGCNKISGTSLVLDEIINHVQSLQRQVEYLSMRLAAVSPRVDFNLDSLLAGNGAFLDSNYQTIAMPATWPELQMNSFRQESQQQWHVQSSTQPIWIREEDHHSLITPESSLLSYDSPHSASLHSGQLKMGL